MKLSTGAHKDDNFEDMCLPNDTYPNGGYKDHWDKKKFKPIEKSIIIKIGNL